MVEGDAGVTGGLEWINNDSFKSTEVKSSQVKSSRLLVNE